MKIVRFNLLVYFMASVFVTMIPTGIRLLGSSMTQYDVNGATVILMGLLPLFVGIYFAARGSRGEIDPGTGTIVQ